MNWKWELSQFDTEILGFKTAKISNIAVTSNRKTLNKNIAELKTDLIKHNIKYVTHRVSADNYSLIQCLEENGYILVDGLITLEAKITSVDNGGSPYIKEAIVSDLIPLVEISKRVFRGVTRYYHDPIISGENADRVYEEWIKNSLQKKVADKVLVWKEKGTCLGFITLQKEGHIPLVAVASNVRGKGIGLGLIRTALETFNAWGLEKVVIETQMTNVPALRLYQSCGFKFVNSHFTFRLSLV